MDVTGNPELDALKREHIEQELARVQRNVDRREARERQKGRAPGAAGASPSAAGSPGAAGSDPDASSVVNGSGTDGTPQKAGGAGRGRNKEGTARKCANCGQVTCRWAKRSSTSRRTTRALMLCSRMGQMHAKAL